MNAPRKILIVAMVGLLTLMGIYTHVSQYSDVILPVYSGQIYENASFLSVNGTTKVILYWTPMFGVTNFYLGLGRKVFEKCAYKNCFATNDKNYMSVERFDAILFHGQEYTASRFGKPGKRDPKQVYVFSDQESPVNTPQFIKNYDNFYNWTMTYRLDSDVLRTYGSVEKNKTDYQIPPIEEVQSRPKKIAWFVSNCHTHSEREKLYNAMRKQMQVDVYGSCGGQECSKESMAECYDMLEKNYKFYLSFENSICEDYVTEKMYNVLKRNIVPIVFGGADYNTIAPPKSVINVMDFSSVRSLMEYIRYLDRHPEEYLKYFEWKKNYVIDTSNKVTVCGLCRKLNEPIEPKVYSDLDTWWRGPNSDKCSNNIINKYV